MAIRIDNDTISDRPWGEVDNAALARRLAEAGDAEAIREAFAYVPDLENRSEWGGPRGCDPYLSGCVDGAFSEEAPSCVDPMGRWVATGMSLVRTQTSGSHPPPPRP